VKSIVFIYIFLSVFFITLTGTAPEPKPPVRCAGIMCNDEDFFFYNYNEYYYFPIVELGGN